MARPAALIAALAGCASAAPLAFYAARDGMVAISGRRVPVTLPASFAAPYATGPINAVALDWEGTSFEIAVRSATFVGIYVRDGSRGNARFGAWVDNVNAGIPAALHNHSLCPGVNPWVAVGAQGVADPDPYPAAIPGLRVATVVTSPYQSLYTVAVGGSALQPCNASVVRVRVALLDEPGFVGDGPGNASLVFAGFVTDGEVAPPAAPLPNVLARRSFLILGDSLTAGYGAGGDAPPVDRTGQGPTSDVLPCGGGTLVNDVSMTYGSRICAAFQAAECQTVAVSGITLVANRPNLPGIFNGSALANIPGPVFNASDPTMAGDFLPAAIVINLGENDCHAWNCSTSPGAPNSHWPEFVSAYVSFVDYLAATYRAAAAAQGLAYAPAAPGRPIGPTFFATIGPHEAGQSTGILLALQQLQPTYDIHFLNATVVDIGPGCGGHPGPTLHAASAERAIPVIASAMGW